MWTTILSFFTGGLMRELNRAFASERDAATEEKRVEAETARKRIQAHVEVQRTTLGNVYGQLMQNYITAIFAAYDTKIIIYDKMLGLGVTDDLSDNFWYIHMMVYGSYFINYGVKKFKN